MPSQASARALSFRVFYGKEIAPYLDILANYRINFFRQYPYLYEGNLAYEKTYLKHYLDNPDTFLMGFFDGEKLGAFMSCMPLLSSADIVKDAETKFKMIGLNAQKLMYIGETSIMPEYRSFTLTYEIPKRLREIVLQLGYEGGCSLTVDRPKNHPLRPADYQDVEVVFKKFGYHRVDITSELEWPTIQPNGTVINQRNKLNYLVCLYTQEAQQPGAAVITRQTTFADILEQAEAEEGKKKVSND
jgi:hypothetical protein